MDPFKGSGGGVLLGDGALGTYLADIYGAAIEAISIRAPDLLIKAHTEYIDAGSGIIETNTFNAGPLSPSETVAEHGWDRVCRASVRAALEAVAGREVTVAGAIGPAPMGYTMDEAVTAAVRQAELLMSEGCGAILLESFWDPAMLEAICRGIQGVAQVPVVAQLSLDSRFAPLQRDWAPRLAALRGEGLACAVGLNCARGPEGMLAAISSLCGLGAGPVSAFPNASLPFIDGGRVVYGNDTTAFMEGAMHLVKAGATLIGGCCGTTPAHIKALKDALGLTEPNAAATEPAQTNTSRTAGAVTVRSHGQTEPEASRSVDIPFRTIVELTPPKEADMHGFLRKAQDMASAGVDAFSITENPMAVPRVGTLAAAHLVQERTGIPCIIHMTCRDRNLVGQRSHLLAAQALGIRYVLAMTGDPVRDPAASTGGRTSPGVFDTNSLGLIQMVCGMEGGFGIGAVMNANARNTGAEVERLSRKALMGARFALTQPLFDEKGLLALKEAVSGVGIKVYPGILPLRSLRNAEFLNREFPGITIPADILETLGGTPDESQREVGLSLAAATAAHTMRLFGGVYLIAQGLGAEGVGRVLQAAAKGDVVFQLDHLGDNRTRAGDVLED